MARIRRPRTDLPITAERVERKLDQLAGIIVARGEAGAVFLPIYRRLETELARLREGDRAMDAVRARWERSQGRTAARSA